MDMPDTEKSETLDLESKISEQAQINYLLVKYLDSSDPMWRNKIQRNIA